MENYMNISAILCLTTTQLGVSRRGEGQKIPELDEDVMNLCFKYIYVSKKEST
jgi:hypothetical protein